MFQSRDVVSQGTINLGTRGPRRFVQEHIVSGRPVTPPVDSREGSEHDVFVSTKGQQKHSTNAEGNRQLCRENCGVGLKDLITLQQKITLLENPNAIGKM